MENKEYFQKRKQERESLEDSLPSDKQMELGDKEKPKEERNTPVYWQFDQNLLSLRSSEKPEDKLFFEKIKKQMREKANKEYEGDIEELNQEVLQEKEGIKNSLEISQAIQKGLNEYKGKEWRDEYVTFLKSSIEAGIITDPEEYKEKIQKGLDKLEGGKWWNDYISLLKSSIEAGIITDLEQYKETIQKGLDKIENWYEYTSALQSAIDAGIITHPEEYRETTQKGLDKIENWYDYTSALQSAIDAGIITHPEEYKETIQKVLDECKSGELWKNHPSLLKSSIEAGIITDSERYREKIQKVLDKCESNIWWENYTSLLKSSIEAGIITHPEEYKETIQKGLDKLEHIRDSDKYTSLLKFSIEAGIITDKETIQENLNEYERNRAGDDYISILKSSTDAGIITDLEQYKETIQENLDRLENERNWNIYTSLLKSSIDAGVIIHPEQYKETIQKGLDEYESSGWWKNYTSLLKFSIEAGVIITHPEQYKETIQKGLDELESEGLWNYYASLLKSAVGTGVIDISNKERIEKIIDKQPSQDKNYLIQNVINHLNQGENLKSILSEYYPSYLALKEESKTWNAKKEPTKRIKDVDVWWEKYDTTIINMQSLGIKLTENFFRNHKDKGLLATQAYLDMGEPVLNKEDFKLHLQEFIQSQGDFTSKQLEDVLQTANAYQKLEQEELFFNTLEQNQDNPNFQKELNNQLLEVVLGSLNIQTEKLPDNVLEGWNIDYLPNLLSNDEVIKQRIKSGEENYENVLELYKDILKTTFEGRFDQFITNTQQKNETGKDVAYHNEQNQNQFAELDIPWHNWTDYNQTQDFFVSTEKEVDKMPFLKNTLQEKINSFDEVISQELENELTTREYQPLRHLLVGTKKNSGIQDISEYNKLNEQYQKLKERLENIRQKTDSETDKEIYKNLNWGFVNEHLSHLKEAIDSFREGPTQNETFAKNFRVKLWDRNPKQDLFQGNYTNCCIAVGVKEAPPEGGFDTHDPATVAQFLTDQGMQVAEVLDESKRDPIAQVWLFVSKDDNGEPILVADNFEVHSDYTSDPQINDAIRDNMNQFITDYAKRCNIPKAGLGKVGTNDVDYSKMSTFFTSPIDKVGGYLNEYTSEEGPRQGRYYLETYNHQQLAEIYNKDKEKEKPEIKTGSVNSVNLSTGEISSYDYTSQLLHQIENGERQDIFSEIDYDDLMKIEEEKFNQQTASNLEDLKEALSETQGIQIFFRDEDDHLKGYLSSKPTDKAYADFREEDLSDPDFHPDPNTLYLESIAGDLKGINFKKSIDLLKEKAKQSGYEKLAFHGINQRLNKILIRYGAEKKREIKNWLGGETAEYLEIEL